MRLFLLRHGNTFETSADAVWAGCKQDLPLVEYGRQQAQRVAAALKKYSIKPVIFAAELKRTQAMAEIITNDLEIQEFKTDSRLNEIDYGSWGGLNNQQIAEKFSQTQLEDWTEQSCFPADADWSPSVMQIKSDIAQLCVELQARYVDRDVLLISSNGILRYFLNLIPGCFEERVEQGTFKMKTGHLSLINLSVTAELKFWNLTPDDLTTDLL